MEHQPPAIDRHSTLTTLLHGLGQPGPVFVRSWGDDDAGIDGDSPVFRAAPPSLAAFIRSVTR